VFAGFFFGLMTLIAATKLKLWPRSFFRVWSVRLIRGGYAGRIGKLTGKFREKPKEQCTNTKSNGHHGCGQQSTQGKGGGAKAVDELNIALHTLQTMPTGPPNTETLSAEELFMKHERPSAAQEAAVEDKQEKRSRNAKSLWQKAIGAAQKGSSHEHSHRSVSKPLDAKALFKQPERQSAEQEVATDENEERSRRVKNRWQNAIGAVQKIVSAGSSHEYSQRSALEQMEKRKVAQELQKKKLRYQYAEENASKVAHELQETKLRYRYAGLKKANPTQYRYYVALAEQLEKEAKEKQKLWKETKRILDREFEVKVAFLKGGPDTGTKEPLYFVSGFDLRLDTFDVQRAYEIRITKLKIFVQV
jgi:hypothetical protein